MNWYRRAQEDEDIVSEVFEEAMEESSKMTAADEVMVLVERWCAGMTLAVPLVDIRDEVELRISTMIQQFPRKGTWEMVFNGIRMTRMAVEETCRAISGSSLPQVMDAQTNGIRMDFWHELFHDGWVRNGNEFKTAFDILITFVPPRSTSKGTVIEAAQKACDRISYLRSRGQ